MTAGDRRDSELERACLDSTEAAILADRRGEIFDGVVVEVDDRGNRDATVVLTDLAVRARCVGPGLVLGTTVRVRVTEADVASRTVRLTVAR